MALEWLSGFVRRYYLVDGYNIVNTLTYGLVLGASIYGVAYLVRKIGLKFDRTLALVLLPFVFYGGSTRELVDRGLGFYGSLGPYPENYFFVAPGIYFSMFVLTFLVLSASALVLGEKYWVPSLLTGLALSAYNVYHILSAAADYAHFGLILVYGGLACLVVYLTLLRLLPNLLSESNMAVVSAHLFDAAATFVGVDYMGFTEKHVLPTYLIGRFGSAFVMFPLKIAVVLPALYVIEKELSGDELSRRLVKFVVFVLGAGPFVRDAALVLLSKPPLI